MDKIAILCNTFCGNSGVDRVVFHQAEEFKQKNKKVTIFTFKCDLHPPEGVDLKLTSLPRNYILEKIWRLLVPVNIFRTMVMLTNLKGYSEIYSHHYPWNWWAFIASRVYGTKYTYYFFHLNPPASYDGIFQKIYVYLLTLLTKWTARRADEAISGSQFSQKSLLEEFGMNSRIDYNGIDESRFHSDINGSCIRLKYGLNEDPIVLFVGRIMPPKCIHMLIEAFYIMKQNVPDAKLIIVGSGESEDYYQKLRQMSDASVIFAGYVDDNELPCYYAACNVYATASLWEGFDLPLEEAKMCGRRVVAFDIGEHRERIKNINDGILVPAGDVALLAKAVQDLVLQMT